MSPRRREHHIPSASAHRTVPSSTMEAYAHRRLQCPVEPARFTSRTCGKRRTRRRGSKDRDGPFRQRRTSQGSFGRRAEYLAGRAATLDGRSFSAATSSARHESPTTRSDRRALSALRQSWPRRMYCMPREWRCRRRRGRDGGQETLDVKPRTKCSPPLARRRR
jgi:hypothetical protein